MFDRLNAADITLACPMPPHRKDQLNGSYLSGLAPQSSLHRSQSRLEEMMTIDGMVRGLANARDQDKIQEDKQFIEEWY